MKENEDFIRAFNEAFSRNDLDFILDKMSDDIVWDFVGDRTVKGKDEVREFMKPMSNVETLKLELLQIITNGSSASANGSMKIKEPSGEVKSFGFADIYVLDGLKSPKITKMTSYVVPVKENQK